MRTISIRLESTVTSAQVAFSMDAVRFTAAGWMLLTSNMPVLDTTKLIQRTGATDILYRTSVMVRFEPDVSDAAKQAFFSLHSYHVLGVTESGTFYVQVPDPGPTYAAYDAMLESLNATAEVRHALPLYRSGGFTIKTNGRISHDSLQ
jgi:hypothetical protein